MIRLDSTQHSVVVLCTACGWRTVTTGDRAAGWALGASHEQRTHATGDGNAARALRTAASRAR